MHISLSTIYNAPIGRVAEVLLSRELADARSARLGLSSYSFSPATMDDAGVARAYYSADIPLSALPEKIRSFLPAKLSITIPMEYRAMGHQESAGTEADAEAGSARTPQQATSALPHQAYTGEVLSSGVLSATIALPGAPVQAELSIHLAPAQSDQTEQIEKVPHPQASNNHPWRSTDHSVTAAHITGSYSVSVPFIGPAIEKKMSRYIDRILQEDVALVHRIFNEAS